MNRPSSTAHSGALLGNPTMIVKSLPTPTPTKTPKMPPSSAIDPLSMRNWSRMSRWRAPRALRTPISRVRSVTETSMMFMMTTPPTTSEMEAMPSTTQAKSPRSWLAMSRNVSLVSISKSSCIPAALWRRVRINTRTSSLARSITSAPPATRA